MLTLEYANCLADRVGEHGLDPACLDPSSPQLKALRTLTQRLAQTRGTGWERWRELPHDPMRCQHLTAVRRLVEQLHGRFDNLVVLGIGGSALGNIALHAALTSPTWNLLPAGSQATSGSEVRRGPRLFVLDNIDPLAVAAVLRFCAQAGGLERTLVNVISKSGETAETAAQFLIVRDRLRAALGHRHREHIVAITDPATGTMRRICDREGYATLPVPDGVGGRFSVLSPVGLFSAAMCGIDIEALLDGAASMDAWCSRDNPLDNPAAMLAFLLVELGLRHGKTCHVMMPYSNSLYFLADWFRQLWAESLGKETDLSGQTIHAGFTPIKALGATDQHSQVQLYREGPNDKVFCFLELERFPEDVAIPSGLGEPALQYLEGASLARLLSAEKRATEYALVESQRPNLTIRFPNLDAFHVGQFIYMWEVVTAYAGLMLNIDAYNQPAVETGKVATFGLMGRTGFERYARDVARALAPTRWTVPPPSAA